jgi:hypothetical protein
MNRQRLGGPLAVLVLVLVLAACQGGRAGSASPVAAPGQVRRALVLSRPARRTAPARLGRDPGAGRR